MDVDQHRALATYPFAGLLYQRDGSPVEEFAFVAGIEQVRAEQLYREAVALADRHNGGRSPFDYLQDAARSAAAFDREYGENVSAATRMRHSLMRQKYGAGWETQTDRKLNVVKLDRVFSIGTVQLNTGSTDHDPDVPYEKMDTSVGLHLPEELPVLVEHSGPPVGYVRAATVNHLGQVTLYAELTDPKAGERVYFGDLPGASWGGSSAKANVDGTLNHFNAHIREISLVGAAALMGAAAMMGRIPPDARPHHEPLANARPRPVLPHQVPTARVASGLPERLNADNGNDGNHYRPVPAGRIHFGHRPYPAGS